MATRFLVLTILTVLILAAAGCNGSENDLGAGKVGIKRAATTEFFTGQHVDATSIVRVAGSDVVGPVGPMIVPLADESAVASFMERHGDTTTFGLDELDDARAERILEVVGAAQDRGAIVVVASHDPRVLEAGLADQVRQLEGDHLLPGP